MDIKEVKELIELINSTDIAYLEIQSEHGHIKIDKSLTRTAKSENISESVPSTYIERKEEIQTIEVKKEAVKKEVVESKPKIEGTIVKSPMVGTFYSSPSPDSEKFAEVGTEVNKGDVICIIEAMKLMNEIESEFKGEVVEVLVKDGDMVEYGTPLFKIKEN